MLDFYQTDAFCASKEMTMLFLYFALLIWYVTLVDCEMLSQPCIPGINLCIPEVIWFARILLMTFTTDHKGYWSIVFF